MKYLILFLIIVSTGSALRAQEWYEGSWVFDATQTQQKYPTLAASEISRIQAAFDKHAGTITVKPKRIKGTKKAKLGLPYKVISKNDSQATVQLKGPIIEIIKAANPNLRKTQMQVKVTKVSYSTITFEVTEMNTIKMYMRRVK